MKYFNALHFSIVFRIRSVDCGYEYKNGNTFFQQCNVKQKKIIVKWAILKKSVIDFDTRFGFLFSFLFCILVLNGTLLY